MRIRVWNAFASNNSGSYVIVGRFPTAAAAAEVAAELRAVAIAHTAWLAGDAAEPSPLAGYAAGLGLVYADADGGDDWPQYGSRDAPDVWAVGDQVFVYADYTVTMPAVIGHAFYARGGRVDTELDHAHHPIVATFELYVPWQARAQTDVPARVQEVVDALCADDGALVAHRQPFQAPAWQGVTADRAPGFGEPDLVVGAVLGDLAAGFAAVAAAAAAAGMFVRVRVAEAHRDRDHDALAFLRPCAPATSRALVDVVVDDPGADCADLVAAVRGSGRDDAGRRLARAPAVILEAVPPARAAAVADELRAAGATISIRPSACATRA